MSELTELLERALTLAEGRGAEDKAPTTVLRKLIPEGAKLHASRGADGKWWYYLVMPQSWRPAESEPRPRWIYNSEYGHYWDSESAATESEALRKGLIRLLGVS